MLLVTPKTKLPLFHSWVCMSILVIIMASLLYSRLGDLIAFFFSLGSLHSTFVSYELDFTGEDPSSIPPSPVFEDCGIFCNVDLPSSYRRQPQK